MASLPIQACLVLVIQYWCWVCLCPCIDTVCTLFQHKTLNVYTVVPDDSSFRGSLKHDVSAAIVMYWKSFSVWNLSHKLQHRYFHSDPFPTTKGKLVKRLQSMSIRCRTDNLYYEMWPMGKFLPLAPKSSTTKYLIVVRTLPKYTNRLCFVVAITITSFVAT